MYTDQVSLMEETFNDRKHQSITEGLHEEAAEFKIGLTLINYI